MVLHVPVHQQPRVAALAVATHGQIPVQKWRISGFWGLHLYRYSADLLVDDVPHAIRYGYAGWTPPGAVAEYRFQGLSTHLYVHLEWPEDQGEPLPMVAPLGAAMPLIWDRLVEAGGWQAIDPIRMNVRVWDVVLEVAAIMSSPETHAAPEPVRRALALIEEKLDEPLPVVELARHACVSHNHLTRLFRQSLGKTVTQTVQERRVARARHLLERSDMPIKEVACLVGLPDLQQFNKTIRRHLGKPPTVVREEFRNNILS